MIMLLQEGLHRTRQHHAIEHATLHVLAERYPQRTFVGYSDPVGFSLYGDVDSYMVRRAVGDALLRLQGGQTHLAIHPNCGTNLAATVLLTAVAALFSSVGQRGLWMRLTSMLMWVAGALVISKPLGLRLQQYTTTAQVADRWVADIRPVRMGKLNLHRVIFE